MVAGTVPERRNLSLLAGGEFLQVTVVIRGKGQFFDAEVSLASEGIRLL